MKSRSRMVGSVDVLIIGGGPAGASTAIWLANAGWKAILVEQHSYPRHKVCGECIAAGSIGLLDDLGVAAAFRRMAGPPLKQVGWMSAEETTIADLPACTEGPAPFGQALGRDRLDELLLLRARALGVTVLQPAKVRAVRGKPDRFDCDVESMSGGACRSQSAPRTRQTLCASVVVDAHGSWDPGLTVEGCGMPVTVQPRRDSDLFAFKATFRAAKLACGFLPVVAFDGGYGGIVVSDHGRTTVACCVRRDTLRACRDAAPGRSAGESVEAYMRQCCRGIQEALCDASRDGPWLSVGPLQPGIRINASDAVFRVGNAAGEAHPLIGEGINMAIQSAALLTSILTRQPAAAIDRHLIGQLQRRYEAAWRAEFAPRLRLAAIYAHAAMRPALALPANAILRRWPSLLTRAARLAGKARGCALRPAVSKESA